MSSADADGKIESFEEISAENGMRNVGHYKAVGKGSTEAKVELKQELAIGLDACSVDGLKGEATVAPLAICVCGGNGADVSTRVEYLPVFTNKRKGKNHPGWGRKNTRRIRQRRLTDDSTGLSVTSNMMPCSLQCLSSSICIVVPIY